MKRLKNSPLTFYEDGHRYLNKQGEAVIGLTTLLRKHGLTKPFPASIPKHVLENARNRGIQVHEDIEMYDMYGIEPAHEWAKPYMKLNLKVLVSEFLVSLDNVVATHIDKVLEDFSVADIKTSYEVDIESVRWQCSMGAYMLEQQTGEKVPNIYLIHLREGEAKITTLERISDAEIEKLLDAERNGLIYENTAIVEAKETLPDHEVSKVRELYEKIKRVEELKKELNEHIYQLMEENDLDDFKSEDLNITRVKPSVSKRFSRKALEEAHPDLDLEPFFKESNHKGYVRITLK